MRKTVLGDGDCMVGVAAAKQEERRGPVVA
jgi:hypothetical protein